MKPKPAPPALVWHDLPTFEQLLSQSALKVAALRLKLAEVPCWRCEDNTVRYDAEGAEAALADMPVPPQIVDGAPVTALTLLDKQIAINAAGAKQHNETLKAMVEPLRSGVEMWGIAWDRQEKRLSALEATFDRMLTVIETGRSNEHERDLALKRHQASTELRGKTFEVVKQQLPQIVNKWSLTKKAQVAVDLVESLDPAMVQALLDSDVLTPDQVEALRQLRGTPAPRAPTADDVPVAKKASEDN